MQGKDMGSERDEQTEICKEGDVCTGILNVIIREGIQEMAECHVICDENGVFVQSVEILRQVKSGLGEE